AVLALYALSGLHVVPPDSLGYRQLFGQIISRDLEPGLHWAPPPPLGDLDVWRVQYPRKSDIGYRTELEMIARRRQIRLQAPPDVWHSPVAAMNTDPFVASYLSGDENLLQLSFSVHYFLSDPYAFFYEVDKSLDLVGLYAQVAARRFIAAQPFDSLLTAARIDAESFIHSDLQERLDGLGTGIRVNSVHLIDIHPPQEAVHAFRDVSSAREDRDTYVQEAYVMAERELPLARGDAAVEIARETGAAEIAVAAARGRAAGFRQQAVSYGLYPDILADLLWLETSETVLANRQKFIVPPGTAGNDVVLWKLPAQLPDDGGR
ncbi:MAG: hypothetical protein GF355_15425, partial [Candidatus Eisenbacteria bacterium]|nr:hypothetical protein [Candidatus Eisenbacteria bacterium]